MTLKLPDISVLILAYNHENFIAEAIQSILDQKTNLDYEIVIGEDCSTDNTLGIIRDFQARYPEKIRVLENAINIGMHDNFLQTLFACRGKYICTCEGDDYWDNPDKLTIQYQFMESHPEYVLVCGNHKKYFHNTGQFEQGESKWIKDYDIGFEKLIRYNCITTATNMYRNILTRDDFAQDYYTIISCDWYLYMKLLKHGKMRFLNQQFAVYRMNDGSVNGRMSRLKIDEREMAFIKLIEKGEVIALDSKRRSQLQKSLALKHFDLAKAHAKSGNRKTAMSISLQTFCRNPLSLQSLWLLTKLSILIISPNIFRALRNFKRSFSHA